MLIEIDVPLNLFYLDHSRNQEMYFRQKWASHESTIQPDKGHSPYYYHQSHCVVTVLENICTNNDSKML